MVVICIFHPLSSIDCPSLIALFSPQFGFKKRKSTGSVDLGKVYGGGRHMVGPDYTFKHFLATAHTVDLEDITIFTKNRLEVS